jgi:hypothetical protein
MSGAHQSAAPHSIDEFAHYPGSFRASAQLERPRCEIAGRGVMILYVEMSPPSAAG